MRYIFSGCQEKFMMIVAALISSSLFLFGCQAKPSLVKHRLEEEGAVFVYLKPFPTEAERLRLRIEEISAVRQEGQTVPLSLLVKEFNKNEMKRERLFASGNLPRGKYTGFSFRLKDATLDGEDGKIALLLAEEIHRIDVPFDVTKGKTVVLSMQFRYRDSIRDGFHFTPSFTVTIPGKIASGLVGLVTSLEADTLTIFNKVSGEVVDVIPTGKSPAGIALDPSSRRAYVAVSGEDAVEAIGLFEAFVINHQRLVAGDNPLEVALTPDKKTLLSTNKESNTVSILDSSSMMERNRLQVGLGPQSLLIDRNGRRAYVFNTQSNTITVVDIAAGAVASTVATDSGPWRGQFNRAGNRLYVLHRDSPYLSVIDLQSLSVLRRINLGSGGSALKVDHRTDLIYIAKRYSEVVDIYDPFSFLPIDTIRAGGEVSYLTIDREGNKLLMVLPAQNRVRIINLVGKGTAAEIDVGESPYWTTIMGEE